MLPEAIDDDARRQRIFGGDEPAGQIETIGQSPLDIKRRQHRENAGLDRIAQREEVAALLNVRQPGLAASRMTSVDAIFARRAPISLRTAAISGGIVGTWANACRNSAASLCCAVCERGAGSFGRRPAVPARAPTQT